MRAPKEQTTCVGAAILRKHRTKRGWYSMKLNRFGADDFRVYGILSCRHSVALSVPCPRCEYLTKTSDEQPHIYGATKETPMAMFYRPLELKGHPGRFRMYGTSDEVSSTLQELCSCENGHDGPVAAKNCETANYHLDQIFGRKTKSQKANDLVRLFRYRNGSEHVAEMEQVFEDQAQTIATNGRRDIEIENALRKLVEAKDAAIRAIMAGRVQDD